MSRRLIYAYFADVFNNYTSSSTIIKMKRGVLAKSFEGQRSHWAMTKKIGCTLLSIQAIFKG